MGAAPPAWTAARLFLAAKKGGRRSPRPSSSMPEQAAASLRASANVSGVFALTRRAIASSSEGKASGQLESPSRAAQAKGALGGPPQLAFAASSATAWRCWPDDKPSG